MLSVLSVPYADVRADQLRWGFRPAPGALAALRLEGPAATLELRLLGSSHAAVLTVGGQEHSEVVACASKGDDGGEPMPADVEVALPGMTYRFRSRTSSPPEGLDSLATALRARFSGHGTSLVGAFPGDPDALTVLHAESPLRWRTWHLYPNSGEVVRTFSTVEPARAR